MEPTSTATRTITLEYFALLRDQAGRDREVLETGASTAAELLAEVSARHGFSLDRTHLRVAINDEFAHWDQPLQAGDRIVFIPPVAGG